MLEAHGLAIWNEGRANISKALKDVTRAKANEAKRWDAQKLAANMQVYQARLDQAVAVARGNPVDLLERLKAIYNDAEDSGDDVQRRAAAEVLKIADSKVRGSVNDPGVLEIHGLTQEAERDLAGLRTSPELEAAHKTAAVAFHDMNRRRDEVYKVADALGELFPNGTLNNGTFIKAISEFNDGLRSRNQTGDKP